MSPRSFLDMEGPGARWPPGEGDGGTLAFGLNFNYSTLYV